ncbi:GGDEF domain-containing protein [Vibrio sonorensis]|uniref:GGDEF domain-containing protein n=1 Tax=Vibrio sonorensis TaxID=1004316 RepID=UPI000B0E6DF4|nr:GGDEF domain-containing protein [Vibrio sonorensis]
MTRVEQSCYQCEFPIPIRENQSARLSLTLKTSPYKYEMLIDGFTKIYRNYLLLLDENERDKLTGLLNRKTLEERMEFCFDFSSANETDEDGAWIVILDIDHFKRINDQHGHMIGDEILLLFSQYMQCNFSSPKQLFRFGGEEFLIIFPPSKKDPVIKEVEGFRSYISNTQFPQIDGLTFSAGVCSFHRHDLLTTILDKADKALYYAKEHGRNKVSVYEELLEAGKLVEDDFGDDGVELF